MIEDRDTHTKVLAAPFDRDTAERARGKFVELQELIEALDRVAAPDPAKLLAGWGLEVTSMGRGPEEDPVFFAAAAAAGTLAGRLARP